MTTSNALANLLAPLVALQRLLARFDNHDMPELWDDVAELF